MDNLSERYHTMSPYHYAGNNPIKNIDIDGNEFTEAAWGWVFQMLAHVQSNIEAENKKISKNQDKLADNSKSDKQKGRYQRRIDRAENRKAGHLQMYSELNAEVVTMAFSNVLYDVNNNYTTSSGSIDGGNTNFDNSIGQNGAVVININSNSNTALRSFAHEFKHGYQYETGKVSLLWDGSGSGSLHNIGDEIAVYERGNYFKQYTPFGINEKFVRKKGYKNVGSTSKDQWTMADIYFTEEGIPIMTNYGNRIDYINAERLKRGTSPVEVYNK